MSRAGMLERAVVASFIIAIETFTECPIASTTKKRMSVKAVIT